MGYLTRPQLEQGNGSRAGPDDALVLVSLCAARCDACRDFAPLFERVASAHAGHVFVWLDVDEDAELCGEV